MTTRPAVFARSIVWLCCLAVLAFNILTLADVSRVTAPSIGVMHSEGLAVDYIAFWGAGALANDGAPGLAYDRAALAGVQSAALGFDYRGEMPWFYPPLTQILTQPFAVIDIAWSLVLWGAVGLAAFLIVAWRICPDGLVLALAAASGPVFSALFTGQIGLFIAAILGMSLLCLTRDLAARASGAGVGAWMALLLLKPQTVFALPLSLAIMGRWRAIGVAIAVGLGLIAASLAVHGAGPWVAFYEAFTGASDYFMTGEGAAFFWARYASVFGAARAYGAPFSVAALAQGALALLALLAVARAIRGGRTPPDVIAAMIAYACALTSPRIFVFDMPLLIVGALFQARAAGRFGWGRGEIAVLLVAFMLAELAFLGRPHAMVFAGPLLMVYAYWRYVQSDAIAINRPDGQVIAGESKKDAP